MSDTVNEYAEVGNIHIILWSWLVLIFLSFGKYLFLLGTMSVIVLLLLFWRRRKRLSSNVWKAAFIAVLLSYLLAILIFENYSTYLLVLPLMVTFGASMYITYKEK